MSFCAISGSARASVPSDRLTDHRGKSEAKVSGGDKQVLDGMARRLHLKQDLKTNGAPKCSIHPSVGEVLSWDSPSAKRLDELIVASYSYTCTETHLSGHKATATH